MRRPALSPGLALAGAILVIGGTVALSAVAAKMAPRIEVPVEAVALSDAQFAFAPEPLHVPPRAAVSITLRNTTAAPHTLILLGPIDAGTEQAVPPGATARIDFTAPEPGSYRFVCNVHEGMAGSLEVR